MPDVRPGRGRARAAARGARGRRGRASEEEEDEEDGDDAGRGSWPSPSSSEAARVAREEAKKKDELARKEEQERKAAAQRPVLEERRELSLRTRDFLALRTAARRTLEQALTAQGRERLRGGARSPWDVEALVGAEVEYDVTCQTPLNPAKPSAGYVPARGRVKTRLRASAVSAEYCADWLLAGTDELAAALARLEELERAQGLPVTIDETPDRLLTKVSLFQGKAEAHERLQAEEGVSVTVPAGTFTGHHVRARHGGKDYELWFGDEHALPWRVLLPEEHGARATIELAGFRQR